jgi:Tol biopolymer transport system component
LATLALCAACATGCAGRGHAPGTIVFEGDRSGREALYAVRPDGSGLTKLLDLPRGANVFWSRDGAKALLLAYRPTALVLEPASRTRRSIRLARFETATDVAPWSDMLWSPEGKRLAYATSDGHIVMLDVASGARRRITDGSSDGAVAWSPGGKRVLLVDWSDGALETAPVNGGPRTRIARLPAASDADAVPEWSGDGKWISLLNVQGGVLYVARADGTGFHSISNDALGAAWSPAGARIAFAGARGTVVVDLEHGYRWQLTRDRTGGALAWSPDGQRIIFTRSDLGHRGQALDHARLWTMKADGTDQHAVTHAFPDGGSDGPALWIRGTVSGTPVPNLPLAAVGARTTSTRLPIVALTAAGAQAAVAQGLGGQRDVRDPLGPIVVWDPVRRSAARISIPGCGDAFDVKLDGVFFTAGGVGYRCDDPFVSYGEDDTLWLVRSGRRPVEIVHTADSEFSGAFVGGLAGDGNKIAFDVGVIGTKTSLGVVYTKRSRIWKATGMRMAIVRTFKGEARVASVDAGRIAVLRDGKAVSVLSRSSGIRTFAFRGGRVLGAALDGPRLVVLQNKRLTVLDLRTGRPTASCPVRRGFGPAPELEDAQGDLAAYVVGVAIHVLRLTDGHEIVIDTRNATEPVFARLVPIGLFYSFNESYAKLPGRLAFVPRADLERALRSGTGTRLLCT